MKHFSTFLFFFLFSTLFSFGQGLIMEKGLNDDYQQEVFQVANKNEFTYLLVKYKYDFIYLEKYDSLGNQLAKQIVNHPNGGFSNFIPQRMVITNDNNVWITGRSKGSCDVFYYWEHVLVYDQSCQLINKYSNESGFNNNSQYYAALTAISDTSVAVNYQNNDSSWVEILSPSTQTVLDNVNSPKFFGFGKNSQFYVLGHTLDKIYGIDAQGALLDSLEMPTFIREVGTWNDTIIALSANSLFKITPDLQSYTTHPIPNLSSFTRLKINSQGVRFVSSNFNKGIHYLDHALNIQSLTTIPVFNPSNTVFDFDQFLTVAKNFILSSYKSVRVANYSLFNSPNVSVNRSDVEVLGIQISDEYAVQVAVGNVYTTDAKATVLIKNNGPNTLDSVRLNHFVSPFPACGDNVTSAYFSGLNLAVGDSVWVDFGWLGEQTQSYSGDSLNRQYCVYSSNPNGIIDLNINNDESCETQFFGFVGLEKKEAIQFQLYPNPIKDKVQIKVPYGFVGQYNILDNSGRLVHSDIVNSTEINLSKLNSGVYFVTLTNEKGTSSIPKKLIKQ